MIDEDVLKIVLNDKTFGQREAADIVGGRSRSFVWLVLGRYEPKRNLPIAKMEDGIAMLTM